MTNLIARLFGAPSLITILRYLLAALGGILVSTGRFDWGQWDTITGAILTLVPLFLGVKATITPKAVAENGATVPLKELPPATRATVNAQAKTVAASKPSLLERLRGLFGRR